MNKKIEYAMYKGDQFITVGTARELAEERNISINTVYFYASPAYKKRIENSSNSIYVDKLEEE